MSCMPNADKINVFEKLLGFTVHTVNEVSDDEDNTGFGIYFKNGDKILTMYIIDGEVFIG